MAVQAIYGPLVESTAVSFEVAVPSIDEMAVRIADRQPAYPFLVAEWEESVVAYAYAGRFSRRAAYDWSVETSAYVSEHARHQGIGQALYAALFAILGKQGYRRAMAGIVLPNPASVALHKACGFMPVGVYEAVGWKLGAWHDVGWWQRGLGTADGPADPLVPLTDLPAGALEAAFEAGLTLARQSALRRRDLLVAETSRPVRSIGDQGEC